MLELLPSRDFHLTREFVQLVGYIAWPVVTVGLIILFKKRLNELFDRVRRVGKGEVEFDGPTDQMHAAVPKTINELSASAASKREAVPRHDQPLFQQLDTEIRNAIRDNVEQPQAKVSSDEFLFLAVVQLFAHNHFLNVYIAIYGSQIEALKELTDIGETCDISVFRNHFNTAKEAFPEIYKKYNFDQWLQFMIDQKLVGQEDNRIVLTNWGRAFIPWINQNYPTGRAG